MTEADCTFRPFRGHGQYGPRCGRPIEDETVHSWPNERKRIGTHVWRHDKRAATLPRPPFARTKPGPPRLRSRDYELGYNSGYVAGRRSAYEAASPSEETR